MESPSVGHVPGDGASCAFRAGTLPQAGFAGVGLPGDLLPPESAAAAGAAAAPGGGDTLPASAFPPAVSTPLLAPGPASFASASCPCCPPPVSPLRPHTAARAGGGGGGGAQGGEVKAGFLIVCNFRSAQA